MQDIEITNYDELLIIDPEQSLLAMEQERMMKEIIARGYGEDDEELEEEEDDYVPLPRNRHIISESEWNAILK